MAQAISKLSRQLAAFASALTGKTKVVGLYDWYPGIVQTDEKSSKKKV
jgi:hypothetical protein